MNRIRKSTRTQNSWIVFVLSRCSRYWWRKNWIRVENVQDFHHCLFFKKSNKTWRNGRSSQRSSRSGFLMRRKSSIMQWDSRMDIGHLWVQAQKKSGMEDPTTLKKGNGIVRQNGATIQRIRVVEFWSIVYGTVANCCYQFGSTEEEKGRASTPFWTTRFWPSWIQK